MEAKWLKISRTGFFLGMILTGFVLGLTAGDWLLKQTEPEASPKEATETIPEPETASGCTRYNNEEFEFSLCYPIQWALPEEIRIEPRQQHLYQITLNPGKKGYMLNVYDRPAPISLGSFVRDYFSEGETGVSWTNDVEINGQNALGFFIPGVASVSSGTGGIAFAKDHLVIAIFTPSKPFSNGDIKPVVNDQTLTYLAESFAWALAP